MKEIQTKSGQIWVETVIYTLIGLTIIAVILAVATPAIERYKDELVIEQTTALLTDLDSTITGVIEAGSGNRRIIPELMIKKGTLQILAAENQIKYTMEKTRLEYSEPGDEVIKGNRRIKTTELSNNYYTIELTLDYDGSLDIQYAGTDQGRTFTEASTHYRLAIKHDGILPYQGNDNDRRIVINIEEVQ